MSWDPSDDIQDEPHADADRLELRFGGCMVAAVSDVVTNLMNDQWEDDDDRALVVETMCEAFEAQGFKERTVEALANDTDLNGWSYPAAREVAFKAAEITGLPVDWEV